MSNKVIINGSHRADGDTSLLIQKIYPNQPTLNLIEYKIRLITYFKFYPPNNFHTCS